MLVELFLLASPVETERLPPDVAELVAPLLDLGVLRRLADGTVCTPSLTLLPVFGYWVFSETPTVDPKLYLGDDSLALLARLLPAQGGRCLDLCCGPGVQSLYSSSFSDHVVGVEINPVAAGLARLNAAMNGRSERVQIVVGDLYDPLEPQRFETIVANPPLLPVPDDLPYPFVGDGGPDGMRVTWRILTDLPDWLTHDGAAQIIGTGLSDGLLPLAVEDLRRWATDHEMDVVMTIPGDQELRRGRVWFDGLVATIAASAGLSPDYVAERYAAFLTTSHATHIAGWYLRIAHGRGDMRVRDLGGQTGSLWFG